MKRILIAVLLFCLAFALLGVVGDAKPKKKVCKKVAVKCPTATQLKKGIIACPDTGCGPDLDPLLNQQKNIQTNNDEPEDKDMQFLGSLEDPVAGYKVLDTREKLEALGEGKMIRIVAFALAARKGSKESCNCGLKKAEDTDNHIVLVEEAILKLKAKATPAKPPPPGKKKGTPARSAAFNTLKRREKFSQTAEFTPRVRLDHPNLAGARLQSLITKAPKQALLVRVTGLQMFDSQHSLCGSLPRKNNWEIHPVMKLEFCPKGQTCTQDSDDNWKDLEDDQP